jgi:hypothetical protein
VNLAKTTQTVALPTKMTDVLAGGSQTSATLAQYGVAVLFAARE